jgi:hypothetical protein
MTIIAGSLKGIAQALFMQGFLLVEEVPFTRAPFRNRGMWICDIEISAQKTG